MAIQGYLRIQDIRGESARDGHEDEIELHGIEFGMAAPIDGGAGGARRGRVTLEPIRVVKRYDRSSAALKQALFRNQVFPEALIAVRRTVDGETSDYLVITMTGANIIEYHLRPGGEPDVLEETLAFSYAEATFVYDGSYEVALESRRGVR
ncbi:type VI secretion system tube protein Hcp [Occultella glacieicola]|uniref:Type VI secretion system tube protein Hcp n=1 Tax=Occultella glacieicola TaxID=2518684 RepID=A0ABY2E2S0_9MICO|nr:type VI secretion system tube protein Hcp [Occultella glacieicola]TDE92524.1 type VI secretion system tube protein Hcp [Occultella glacieicola]